MTIIDRYLLRQFVQTFLICFLSLTGIYVVFDAFTNLEAFLHCAKGLQLLKVMGVFYGFQSIFFFDRTSSLLTLMAAMFTVAWIQRHNEMTALMAAGISRIRVVAPVIIAAIVISVLATINREGVIPQLRKQLAQRPGDLAGSAAEDLAPQYDNRTEVLFRGKAVYAAEQRIERPDFLMPPNLREYGKQIVADNAYFRTASTGRPTGYLMDGVREPKKLAKQPSLVFDGKPLLITPRDAPDWLQPNQCFLVTDVSFDQLNGGRAFRSFASTAQLITGLRNRSLDLGSPVRVTIHSRIVQPVLDIALLFLGLPLIVWRGSRNVFVAIGLCIGVVSMFLMVVIGFQQLGSVDLISASMAAWAPLFLFIPPAVAMGGLMWENHACQPFFSRTKEVSAT